MNLLSINEIKTILSKHNAKPSKIMGQNFLIDLSTLNKIIASAELSLKDTILEIGPGIGTLTKELAKKAGKVIAIEKDKMMIEILKETLKNFKNVDAINGDILKINFQLPKRYKIISNLPYYITSPVIRKFLEAENQPSSMILMVQKEVAQRICAKPPKMSLLAVSVQFYAKPEIISYVSKECFWPSPKVDSVIIKITPFKKVSRGQTPADLTPADFFKIVKAGFSQPRKQLSNNLSKSLTIDKEDVNLWLLKNKISPEQRAQTLTVADWKNLTDGYGK